MRLSTVVELFLILLLVAFAAYGRVIDRDEVHSRSVRAANSSRQLGIPNISLKQAADSVNRYCTCNENICNCCRDFHIPLVQLKGPGCASLQYLQDDNLAVQLSFGENILTSTIVNGKNPKPVCVPLPGGFTKFCGRIYSIQRDAKNHFKACLGLELQSSTELEASLRVSCFRFGPDGLKLRPAEPLPVVEAEAASDEDDDDDFFGFGGDDDDDEDEEEDDTPVANSVSGQAADEPEEDEDDDDDDILGLGSLFDIIAGDDDTTTKRPKVTTEPPRLEFTIPILNRPSTVSPIEPHDPLIASNVVPDSSDDNVSEELSQEPDNTAEDADAESTDLQVEEVAASAPEETDELVPETSNQVASVTKPNKSTNKVTVTTVQKKKPAASVNAIEEDTKKKPVKKPQTDDDDDDDLIGEEDLDDDDEEDDLLNDEADKDDEDEEDEASEEDEDEDEKVEDDKHEEDEDEKAEDIDDLDDDDDEEEDALISDLVYDDKEKAKKGKPLKNKNSEEDDDSDYGLGLSGFLARKREARAERQSRVMKL